MTRRGRAAALALGALAATCGFAASPPVPERGIADPAPRAARSLKLATWNLEWLIAPSTFRALAADCVPERERISGSERRLPCDIAATGGRSQADFDALARYARRLDADVIALQEVDGPGAAQLVFPGYRFCFTKRRNLQNNGFAIRAGIPHRCDPDVVALGLDDTVRRGAAATLYPGDRRAMRLLSVHLKSGCGNRLLDSGRKECKALARQVGALEDWIDATAAKELPFAVLGDFNRNLTEDQGRARNDAGRLVRLWPEIDDGDPPEADLTNTAEGQRFTNCAANQAYRGYIDYIVLSRSLAARVVPGSFERLVYRTEDALRRQLSDHCPVAIRID